MELRNGLIGKKPLRQDFPHSKGVILVGNGNANADQPSTSNIDLIFIVSVVASEF